MGRLMKCSNQNALARARKAPVQTDDARRDGSCQGKFGILEKKEGDNCDGGEREHHMVQGGVFHNPFEVFGRRLPVKLDKQIERLLKCGMRLVGAASHVHERAASVAFGKVSVDVAHVGGRRGGYEEYAIVNLPHAAFASSCPTRRFVVDAGVVTVFTQYSSDEAERDRTFQTTCPPPLRKAGTHRDRCFSAATTRFRRCTFPSDNRT